MKRAVSISMAFALASAATGPVLADADAVWRPQIVGAGRLQPGPRPGTGGGLRLHFSY
ncbi:MAG TPA: hypothetical protein VGH91_01530 [Gammaproteobacteria bacterium]